MKMNLIMIATAWVLMHQIKSEAENPHIHEDIKYSPIQFDYYNVTGTTSFPANKGFDFDFKKKPS